MSREQDQRLRMQLEELRLDYVAQNHEPLAQTAAEKHWTHVDYLARLIDGQSQACQQRSIQRRIQAAGFPVIKTVEDFDWNWPKKINRPVIQNLMRLGFVESRHNVVLVGGVGLGKTHLAIALGHAACMAGHTVRFTTAVEIINTLTAAQVTHRMKSELKKFVRPGLLCIDEVGYLPIDKLGADLLFQVISERYERGSIVLTTNQTYKNWPKIFNGDATLTSAVLDRLLHHAETVVVEGKSYRMKDQIQDL
jgi:DNA replication protein DnaC